jgi:tetraacyldisaccharide 4'-kinase
MRAPAFWWAERPTALANLLRPISTVYGAIAGRRMSRQGEKANLPIVCIGNFTAGGAGKTPTALAIAELLDNAGESPAFLSRGYGGRLRGPLQVQPYQSPIDVGDEPILLAGMAPTIVSRNRPAGAHLAYEMGATVVIMDDGLQNASLQKDCGIAVVDAVTGIGNGLPMPAGPLRTFMDAQWSAIDALLLLGAGAPGESLARQAGLLGKRVFRGRLAPDPMIAKSLEGKRVLAFAGIGRPEKFFETLRECGAIVEVAKAFPDHHPYNAVDLDNLRQEARQRGLMPVTTEKDLVRISAAARSEPWTSLSVLPVRLKIEDTSGLRNYLLRRINDRRLRGA